MNRLDDVTGLLLAGGRATRMGGRDKGLIELAGRPLAAHVLAQLAPQVHTVLINANRHGPDYEALGAPVVADPIEGFLGPLAGVLAGLEVAVTPLVATLPCDSPFLPDDLVRRLHRGLGAASADIAVAHDGERRQPVFMLLRTGLAPNLRRWLDAGGRKIDAWYADHAPGAIDVARAHRRIAAAVAPVAQTETVGLRASLGRVLAEDVRAPFDIPPDTNAAMDGYALRGADLESDGGASLTLIGTAWAGHPLARTVGPGECARIMTGAPVPAGADPVVMQERTEAEGERIRVRGAEAGANVRMAGEDLPAGGLALAAGTWVRPAELGVLASLGLTEITVRRRPRVAVFATGDELHEPGQALGPGGLYDSNRYTVWAMLERLGMQTDDRGHLPDDRTAVEASLLAAAAENDVIITTGGVSVGAADHIGGVLREQGDVAFWQITMKPGRPLHFARIGGALMFGLPGNPVSAMVTFYQFVQPALRAIAGAGYQRAPTLRARTAAAFPRKPGRTEYQRARLSYAEDGTPEVERVGPQGSGRLSSMSRADCFVVIPADSESIAAGEWVDVQAFEGLV